MNRSTTTMGPPQLGQHHSGCAVGAVEVSDSLFGLAQALQPDLILLDIGLPKVNGIEAAGEFVSLPRDRRSFLSAKNLPSISCKEPSVLGASGYVVKMDTGRELLNAVRPFFGARGLSGADLRATVSPELRMLGPPKESEARVFWHRFSDSMEIARRHEAGFYSDDRRLLDDLTEFIGAALMAGNAAIVVATESHRDSLLQRLQAHGLDIAAAIEQGRYISLDAADTLSTFMLNGMPDPVRFLKLLRNLIATAAKAARENKPTLPFLEKVRISCGRKATQRQRFGSNISGIEIAKTYDVDILCGYSLGSVQGGMDSHIFQRICAEHSAVHSR